MNGTHNSIKESIWRVACALAVITGSLLTIGTAAADSSANKSNQYAQECLNKGVPLPPVFGTTNNFWKYTGQLAASEVFVDNPQPTDIYYFISNDSNNGNSGSSQAGAELHLPSAKKNPHGVCMMAIRKASGTQTCGGVSGLGFTESFQVICQGNNGSACFWNMKKGNTLPWGPSETDYPSGRAIVPPYTSKRTGPPGPQCLKTTAYGGGRVTDFGNGDFNATVFDLYITQWDGDVEGFDNRGTQSFPTWVGGTTLVGNKEGVCTACHAGENVFINHPGSATDINPHSSAKKTNGSSKPHVPAASYFPATWPNPIVPNADPATGGGPWPQNPPLGAQYGSQYASDGGCFSCHDGVASSSKPGGRFPKISELASVDGSRNYCSKVFKPSVTRTGTTNGAMPPGTSTKAYDNNMLSKWVVDNDCTPAPAPMYGANGKTTAADSAHPLIHKSSYQSGFHEHSFTNRTLPAGATGLFNANDRICVDGFVTNTGNQTPSQVALQFYSPNGGGWNHRAYWGSNTLGSLLGWGGGAGNVQINSSATPNGKGFWQPYCVTASLIGLDNKSVTGMAFTLYGGSMWWGNVYRYVNGKGSPQTLFTASNTSSATLSAAAGDFWRITSTPTFLHWNPASWSSFTFGPGNNGAYGGPDQIGNVNLGAVQDNYCYMNSFYFAAEDEIALSLIGGGSFAPWSLGGWNNAPSGRSAIGANCVPWKEMVSVATRAKMGASFPPVVINGEWKNGNYNYGPSPDPTLIGGSPSTNVCVLDGLWESFNTLPGFTASISIAGTGSTDAASGWFAVNKIPDGLVACTDVGLGKLSPVPASAYTRGKTNWYALNSGSSVDVSKQTGSGNNANNQFCYLVGIETKDAVSDANVNLVVADGSNGYTDSTGATIPAGRWVAYGGNGVSRARIACQSVPY